MVIDQTMSDFDQTEYQAKTILELTYIIQTQKIPNALLFCGNHNTGRKEAAFLFAKGCNCLTGSLPACNQCPSCRKIDAQSHPDILTVTLVKGKKIISISQIRELGLTISSRPNEARFRMALILNADLMNIQAQNALLKMLEEPPERTFFILIASTLSTLLPTILSRCRKIRFKPLTDKFITQYLTQNFKINKDLAQIAAKTADADLKKAKRYLNLETDDSDTDWIKRRDWLLNSLSNMIKTDQGKSISKGLMLSQRLSMDPGLIDDSMAIMKTFFRDLMIFKFHPQKIVNLDFSTAFTDINRMIVPVNFSKWVEYLYDAEKKLAANSTLRLTLDSFFLKIIMNKGNLLYD